MTAIYDNYLALVDHLSPKEREELEAFVPDDPWRLTGCEWINTMLRKEFSLTDYRRRRRQVCAVRAPSRPATPSP